MIDGDATWKFLHQLTVKLWIFMMSARVYLIFLAVKMDDIL